MSAFIVSKRHIDVIVSSALSVVKGRSGSSLSWQNEAREWVQYPSETTTEDTLGQMLWAENLKSLQARYPRDHDGDRPGPNGFRDADVTTYQFEPLMKQPSIVETMKAIHCYEYQSCEHAAWPSSEAAAFCQALQRHLITLLPDYEEAPWSWD